MMVGGWLIADDWLWLENDGQLIVDGRSIRVDNDGDNDWRVMIHAGGNGWVMMGDERWESLVNDGW